MDCDRAVARMDKSYLAVLKDVRTCAVGNGKKDPTAVGLYKGLRSVWFLTCLALFRDLMPPLNKMIALFQARDIDLSAVTSLLPASIATVKGMMNEETGKPPAGSARANLPARFAEVQAAGIELAAQRYHRDVRSARAAKDAPFNPRGGNHPRAKKPRAEGSASLPLGPALGKRKSAPEGNLDSSGVLALCPLHSCPQCAENAAEDDDVIMVESKAAASSSADSKRAKSAADSNDKPGACCLQVHPAHFSPHVQPIMSKRIWRNPPRIGPRSSLQKFKDRSCDRS
jgi:hypothetical protein